MKLLEFLHVKPGKGAAFVRSKVKNLLTGTVQEKTFRAGESFNDVEIDRKDVQFSYTDGSEKCFMDMKTFEEIRISDNEIPNHKFLVEGSVFLIYYQFSLSALLSISLGMICTLARWGDVVIDVDLPLTYTYTVVGFPLTSKDSGGQKTATLDCGVTMYVPSFVHEGDKISVNIEKREYAGRA